MMKNFYFSFHLSMRPFWLGILVYITYLALVWLGHTLVISVATFFQLQLKYPISMIENWVFDESWWILFFSKGLSFLFLLPFLLVMGDSKSPIRDLYNLGKIFYQKRETTIIIIVIALFLIMIGRPSIQELNASSLTRFITMAIGSVLLYCPDYLILLIVFTFNPMHYRYERFIYYLLIPVLFYKSTLFSFSYGRDISFLLAFHLAIMMLLGRFYHKGSWFPPLIYLMFVIIPLSGLLGKDPFWVASYSPFKMQNDYSVFELVGLVIIVMIYYRYRTSIVMKLNERWGGEDGRST